jgi:integrase
MYTSCEFLPDGIASAGVPVILGRDARIFEPGTAWLFDLALAAYLRPNSLRSYADALCDWIRTCDASDWDWTQVHDGHLNAYRLDMLHHPSEATKSKFEPTTINARIRRIDLFYKFAYRNKFIHDYPFSLRPATIRRASERFLAHLRPAERQRNRYLLPERRKRILRFVQPEIYKAIRSTLSEVDSLISDWLILSGARRQEILDLTVEQIPDARHSQAPLVQVNLLGKGDVARSIYVPLSLIDRTYHYVAGPRQVALREATRAGRTIKQASALWLMKSGKALAARTLSDHFLTAGRKVGAPTRLHDLRHTYAVSMLLLLGQLTAAEPESDINALQVVRILLGHKSIVTTTQYLDTLRLLSPFIEQAVIQFKAMTDGCI